MKSKLKNTGIYASKEKFFDSLSEEQLVKHIETLDFDDYFTIDLFIVPRLKVESNIKYANMLSRQRYHTYGDVR